MGKKALELLGLEPGELLSDLNKALADEWLAYYQYWQGSYLVRGHPSIALELREHAEEEKVHADLLVKRIVQLGGRPLDFGELMSASTCGYQSPGEEPRKILEQNLEGERCAIEVYSRLLEKVKGKDEVTYHLILGILRDELEHEEDLENLLAGVEG